MLLAESTRLLSLLLLQGMLLSIVGQDFTHDASKLVSARGDKI